MMRTIFTAAAPLLLLVTASCYEGDSKTDRASLTTKALEMASKAFHVKNDKYPEKLEDLVTGDRPFYEGGENSLIDPWGSKSQYDPKGPKNGGKMPDIWTVTPDKKTIGNWDWKK
jgi:hypothetical protein